MIAFAHWGSIISIHESRLRQLRLPMNLENFTIPEKDSITPTPLKIRSLPSSLGRSLLNKFQQHSRIVEKTHRDWILDDGLYGQIHPQTIWQLWLLHIWIAQTIPGLSVYINMKQMMFFWPICLTFQPPWQLPCPHTAWYPHRQRPSNDKTIEGKIKHTHTNWFKQKPCASRDIKNHTHS